MLTSDRWKTKFRGHLSITPPIRRDQFESLSVKGRNFLDVLGHGTAV